MNRKTLSFLFVFLCLITTGFAAYNATGGTITTVIINGSNYTIHTFTGDGTFAVTGEINATVLVVAGGGGGGFLAGGGGGAGGLIYNTSYNATGNIAVTIGAGGLGGVFNTVGSNGANSVFGSITTIGGGGGGNDGGNGIAGGSGSGGSGGAAGGTTGGAGTSGQGYNGGRGYANSYGCAGGGGSSSAIGGNASQYYGGNGSNGLAFNISGTVQYYAGGGGGANYRASLGDCDTAGLGGLGGGGNGSTHTATNEGLQNATQNTGGGGGGTSWEVDEHSGRAGNGGSGIVIIRYLTTAPTPSDSGITFISQSPSDLTTTNAIAGLKISYNITNITSGTPYLSYKVNSSTSNVWEYINGTAISGWINKTGTNVSSVFNFTLFDNDFIPATYNLNNSAFNQTHSAFAMVAQSNFASIELLNVSSKQYGFLEVMVNGSNANPIEFYYCNSSYAFNGISVQSSPNCGQFGTLTANGAYNHSHNTFSSHRIIPFAINTTSGNVLGTTIKATSQSFFMVRGATATTTNIYSIPNTTRLSASRTTTNNGNAWTNKTYTFDAHLHQFNGTDILYYQAFANVAGVLISSNISNDTFDFDPLPPTPPIVLTPTTGNKYGFINITWNAAQNQTPSTIYYNISLLNQDLTFNKTISANVSTNVSYNWNTAGMAQGNYVIRVTVFDNNSFSTSDDSEEFTIATFTATSINPTSGQSFAGNQILFTYSQDSTIANASCALRIDGSTLDTQTGLTGTYSFLATIANGSHSWVVNCSDTEGAGFTYQTTNRTFTINFYTFNTQANLTNAPENVLSTPQALFFDINGNLNVLYFTDEGTSRTLRIKTISGTSVIASANLTLEPTAQFFIVFRGTTNTTILTRNATDSTKGILLTLAGNILTQAPITLPSANALNLTAFDAYTYANTKAYPTITIAASSYWLYTTPIATGSNVTKWNGTAASVIATFVNSVAGQYQTIANVSTLTNWLYIAPVNSGGDNILHVYSYNGTGSTDIATLDPNAYSTAIMNTTIAGFEKYANKTYAYATNISARTTILLIEENKTFQMNTSISNPSHFLFTDEYTFIFFATSGGDTYAYTCYFEGVPTCSNFTSSQYGVTIPYEQGFMSSAKREANRDDTVVRGMIQSGSVVSLDYNINTYDMKFICYDEKNDARKLFLQRTVASTSASSLLNETWGYVLPSSSVGTGLRKIYSTCQNGTQRLFLTGLTGNFSIYEYTLASTAGVYYSFTVKDRYGVGLQDVKVSMLRFSTLKQAFVVIEQCLSDFNGGCVFFLEPYNSYKILIEASGFTTQYVDFTPSSVTTITIALDASGTSFTLPNYNYIFEDLTTSLTPIANLMNNASNITFTVASNGSNLQYYGMTVFKTANGTRAQVYTNNVSGQPSGGSIQYLANATGRYDVEVWAKHQNFTIYDPMTRSYTFQIKSGLVYARDALVGSSEFSGWSLYFLGVFVTMLVVGFVSRYTIDGAGIVGLMVLWGFTLLNPSAIIYQAGAIVITTTMVSIVTTIAAVAALYLRYSAQSGG